jgi:hypothetical protein
MFSQFLRRSGFDALVCHVLQGAQVNGKPRNDNIRNFIGIHGQFLAFFEYRVNLP